MNKRKFAIAVIIGVLGLAQPVMAAETLQQTLKRMTDLIAAQQKELEAQRRELAEQREMIRQLQEGQSGAPPREAPRPAAEGDVPEPAPELAGQATGTDEPPSSGDEATAQDKAKEALAKQQAKPKTVADELSELQAIVEDPSNTVYDEDFVGAWYLPGTTAAMRLGGYVNLSYVNSFDPMLISDRFIVGSIPPDGVNVQGAVEGTSVTADQTRVNLEYREQTNLGEIRAFIEGDFRGNSETFRLRHAFGQFRAFLAGKTWSTLMDVDARPEEVDIEGINGQVLLRHSQVRWSPSFGKKNHFKLALEDAKTDVINGDPERGRSDLVMSLDRMPLGPLGNWNYRVGLILRDLKATDGSIGGPGGDDLVRPFSDSTTGWGVTTGGRQPFTWRGNKRDFILWQLTYGKGISHYLNDPRAVIAGDVVFDPTGKLHAIPVFAGYLSYQHFWPMRLKFMSDWSGVLRSNFNFSWVDFDTFRWQKGTDYSRTLRASANLIYNPTPHVQLGIEFLWGERKNKDGSKGTATQLQVAARYTF